jgi:hypothetical protein
MSRRFTLEEAQGFLPQIEKGLREVLSLKSQYEEAESSIQSFAHRVMMMGGVLVDRKTVADNKARRDGVLERLKTALEGIQEVGCIVKDLDMGLVDFPTLFRGKEVYLCWKLGEVDIRFWHSVDEGFAGRQKIDQDFIENHQGDAPN